MKSAFSPRDSCEYPLSLRSARILAPTNFKTSLSSLMVFTLYVKSVVKFPKGKHQTKNTKNSLITMSIILMYNIGINSLEG